ncbi:unnamed protein product [Arctogadus glacialis]
MSEHPEVPEKPGEEPGRDRAAFICTRKGRKLAPPLSKEASSAAPGSEQKPRRTPLIAPAVLRDGRRHLSAARRGVLPAAAAAAAGAPPPFSGSDPRRGVSRAASTRRFDRISGRRLFCLP